jgi:hypothetical protein
MTFDMQAARELCEKASFHLTGNEIDEDLKTLVDQAAMLPAALDEIDRLIHSVDEAVIQLGACRLVAKQIQNGQAKQIESWRQACFLRTQVVGQVERENHKLRDQIATLKDALIDRDWRLLQECNGECDMNDAMPEDCDKCEHDSVLAKLARELPEIDWGGKA